MCSVFSFLSVSCRFFSSAFISSNFLLWASCFSYSASFCLFFAFSSLRCAMYSLYEFSAVLTVSNVIGTLSTPQYSCIAALTLLSPVSVVSLIMVIFCFITTLLLTLNDLSTSAFEWHRAKAHFIILGNALNWSPLASALVKPEVINSQL